MPDVSGAKDAEAEMEIDRNAAPITEALDARGKLYRKVAQVRARRAIRETAVHTILADGTRETSNIAEPGDYIVTAPGGERYVVKPEIFEARYVLKRGRKNVYLARGQSIAVQNPYRRPISILAPWGERQHGAADCMIADVADPVTHQRAGAPYLIARDEFERTYKLVKARTAPASPAHRRTKQKLTGG